MLFIPLYISRFPPGIIDHFPSTWKASFHFSGSADLLEMISFNFCVSAKICILPLLLKDFLCVRGIEFQIDNFFLVVLIH